MKFFIILAILGAFVASSHAQTNLICNVDPNDMTMSMIVYSMSQILQTGQYSSWGMMFPDFSTYSSSFDYMYSGSDANVVAFFQTKDNYRYILTDLMSAVTTNQGKMNDALTNATTTFCNFLNSVKPAIDAINATMQGRAPTCSSGDANSYISMSASNMSMVFSQFSSLIQQQNGNFYSMLSPTTPSTLAQTINTVSYGQNDVITALNQHEEGYIKPQIQYFKEQAETLSGIICSAISNGIPKVISNAQAVLNLAQQNANTWTCYGS